MTSSATTLTQISRANETVDTTTAAYTVWATCWNLDTNEIWVGNLQGFADSAEAQQQYQDVWEMSKDLDLRNAERNIVWFAQASWNATIPTDLHNTVTDRVLANRYGGF